MDARREMMWKYHNGVIASEVWQSRREKLCCYENEDMLFMRWPRFARNDTFNLGIFNKSVT